jgi:AmiR/NasT family two-component response regulator
MVATVGAHVVMEEAEGILMERHKLAADEAFPMLVHAGQQTNRKLAAVARELAETGELPGPAHS